MITLLSDRFAPVTSTFGFLRAPLDEAANAFLEWRGQLHDSATATPVQGDFSELVGRLEPLTAAIRPRELLVATTDPDWTAYFDCGLQGGDPFSSLGHVTSWRHWQGVVVSAIPHTDGTGLESPGRYGSVQFLMLGPVQTDFLNYVRNVGVTHDGHSRWEFVAEGTVQDFEQVEAYTARRVRDRFTTAMLSDYCAALGLRPFDIDFYGRAGVVVESRIRLDPALEPLSLPLAEAQKFLGIVPGVADKVPG
jgi:hypothetical protein